MAFRIKDLMINISPSEPEGENAACGKKTDFVGCPGKRTDYAGCEGRHTDVVLCVGGQSDVAVCVGKHTDIGCTKRTDAGGMKRADAFCTKKSPVCVPGPGRDTSQELAELNAIKAQLQTALAEVDEEIKDIEDSLHPKTLEEVENLQTKLQEAMDELGKIKSELEQKG